MRTLTTCLAGLLLTGFSMAQSPPHYHHDFNELGCGFHVLGGHEIPNLPAKLAKTCKHWDYGFVGLKLFIWSDRRQKLVFHSEVPEGTENNPDVIYERMRDAEQKDAEQKDAGQR